MKSMIALVFNTGNSRNGSYDRTVKTEYGELHPQIPRDRNGEFKQQTVPRYRRTNDTLEETIIHLFRKRYYHVGNRRLD